jgi:hypothetical protein
MKSRLAIISLRFVTLILAAFSLVLPVNDLLELPRKIRLSKDDYETAQYIGQGWSWLEFVRFGSILAISILLFYERENGRLYRPALGAFVGQLLMTIIFIFTLPVTVNTRSWTYFPDNWVQLRQQWEYLHAADAIIGIIAFLLLSYALVRGK